MGIGRVIPVGTSSGVHVTPLIPVVAVGLVPLGASTRKGIRRKVRDVRRETIKRKLAFVFADPALITLALVEEKYRTNNSPRGPRDVRAIG